MHDPPALPLHRPRPGVRRGVMVVAAVLVRMLPGCAGAAAASPAGTSSPGPALSPDLSPGAPRAASG